MDQMNFIIQMLNKMDRKLDHLDQRLAGVESTNEVQNDQLKMHMKRSDSLEENLNLLRKDFKPVQRHMDTINSLAKISVAVLGLSGSILALLKILSKVL